MTPLWPHQQRGISEALATEQQGCRAMVVTSPTGGGKTRMQVELAKISRQQGKTVAIFTNRRILTSQGFSTLEQHGVNFGVIAAGYDPALLRDVQLCSIQTIASRVFTRGKYQMPQADRVIIDEAHGVTADIGSKIIHHYKQQGSTIIGFTATPVDLGGLYDKLIVAGTNHELRGCGALVPCDVFAPEEPDMKGVRMSAVGEYVQDGMRKRVMQCTVFGSVMDNWQRLNPTWKPTLLFAPGVPESKWFCEHFNSAGVPAAHIDADTNEKDRQEIFQASKAGQISIVCSFGVLREGADLPWIEHGILAQVCGGLSTYLQVVGRLLRASPGKVRATLQDHSGAWHRHGSPNTDRTWSLNDSDKALAKERRKTFEEGNAKEPICCPKCGAIRSYGPTCPYCGHRHTRSVRMVRQTDGELKRMVGSVVKRKIPKTPEQKAWESCLWSCGLTGRTFAQAKGLYQSKHKQSLPAGLEWVPAPHQWHLRIGMVYPHFARRRRSKA